MIFQKKNFNTTNQLTPSDSMFHISCISRVPTSVAQIVMEENIRSKSLMGSPSMSFFCRMRELEMDGLQHLCGTQRGERKERERSNEEMRDKARPGREQKLERGRQKVLFLKELPSHDKEDYAVEFMKSLLGFWVSDQVIKNNQEIHHSRA